MNDIEIIVDSPKTVFINGVDMWVSSHPYLGWVLLVIFILGSVLIWTIRILPEFDNFRAKILKPFVRKRKFNKLTQAAIKYDIRGRVNKAVRELQTELPLGWIKEMDIEWVPLESREDFLDDDNIVVKAKPYEDQNRNFVMVTYHFLHKCFFPRVKKVIPEIQRDAAVLCIEKRIIENRQEDMKNVFVSHVLEPIIDNKDKVIDYYEKYQILDGRGLFTGPFLREVQNIAERVRESSLRKNMGEEVANVLKHLTAFKDGIIKKEKDNEDMPIDLWSREGIASKYAIILVANPEKVSGGVQAYVKRANQNFDEGVDRLYVLGNNKEIEFVERVISSIKIDSEYKIKEVFDQNKDYRGHGSGYGALFIRNEQK